MAEEQYVSVVFEREGLEGIVAVGSYLADAAKRIGVRFEEPCSIPTKSHVCRMTLLDGGDLLSDETVVETEFFAENDRKAGERLGCVAKFEKAGEAKVMTKEKDAPIEDEATREDAYRKKFAELPLDRKISQLVQLEAMALSDTLSYMANSPYKVADKVMDVLAGLGFKKEQAERDAVRPDEHKPTAETDTEDIPAEEKKNDD